MAEQEHKVVTANGLQFAYLEAGSPEGDKPLVVCVHGYPDTAHAWDHLLPRLAEAGYWAVAMYQRGYYPSGAPTKDDYAPPTLGRDLVAFVKALGRTSAIAIGQDWGAMTVYMACLIEPSLFPRAITVAIPHPRTLKPSLGGVYRARHFIGYKLPWAVHSLKSCNFAHVDEIVKRWSPTWKYPASETEDVKRCFAEKNGAKNALGYYRAFSFNPSPEMKALLKNKTTVPTLCVCGLDDGATAHTEFDTSHHGHAGYFQLVKMKGVGHFCHREDPDTFARVTLEFLAKPQAELVPPGAAPSASPAAGAGSEVGVGAGAGSDESSPAAQEAPAAAESGASSTEQAADGAEPEAEAEAEVMEATETAAEAETEAEADAADGGETEAAAETAEAAEAEAGVSVEGVDVSVAAESSS